MESLFVYGTLDLAGLMLIFLKISGGTWQEGHVGGSLLEKGWGAEMGYPGIVLDDSGHRVPGFLFKSENLHNYWHLLDEFEGSEYERVPVEVTTSNGQTVQSYLYMLKA